MAAENTNQNSEAHSLERTSFQTSQPWSESANLPADVAIAYGIDAGLPERIRSWKDHGYKLHVMTGVSWGRYQDYVYGRFDGVNHEDEAQTEQNGNKIGHGGDVYYMCPGTNYGKFLCVGVQRALDGGAEAIHLEEPEFWVRAGYSEGFKREWRNYYHEEWQPPHTSVDAQWRASKLKYFLYRRALQQVFDYVQDHNRRTGSHVRCYVPTHSLLNYAHWRIVSPESSLARINGCDGYIAQVWTGTARTPNLHRGELRERTFETAFLEYGAMQNLVRATGQKVWYLNDPIEDNPNHDWTDYRSNWESTLVASLLQPEASQFEIAPWPERIFTREYPRNAARSARKTIPAEYATELQVVMKALNNMQQREVVWDCGTTGIGLLVGDSLMFERGEPTPSDTHLSQVYGLALPLLTRGMPITPVQLENVGVPHYLDSFRILLLTYHGMKPLGPEVHGTLANWVKQGGVLIVWDDDGDPYNKVREWWNSEKQNYASPRQHLFEQLGLSKSEGKTNALITGQLTRVGKGAVMWRQENPALLATTKDGDLRVLNAVKLAAQHAQLKWRESNYISLRRGPYIVAAGLENPSSGPVKEIHGRFVNLFDPALPVRSKVRLEPGSRFLLLDLDKMTGRGPELLASAGKASTIVRTSDGIVLNLEGIAHTPGLILLKTSQSPHSVTLGGQPVGNVEFSAPEKLCWIRFENEARPRELSIKY